MALYNPCPGARRGAPEDRGAVDNQGEEWVGMQSDSEELARD